MAGDGREAFREGGGGEDGRCWMDGWGDGTMGLWRGEGWRWGPVNGERVVVFSEGCDMLDVLYLTSRGRDRVECCLISLAVQR